MIGLNKQKMKRGTFIFRSLQFYKYRHFASILGIALSTAIIIGALGVGSSVKKNLLQIVDMRLGKTEKAILSRNNMFHVSLAQSIKDRNGSETCPLLILNSVVSVPNSESFPLPVQLIGMDSGFAAFSPGDNIFLLPEQTEVVINEQLSQKLKCNTGDELILRIGKPFLLSPEAPLASTGAEIISLRVKIAEIATVQQFGDFNLQNSQLPPLNVFISLNKLNKVLGFSNKANTLLISPARISADNALDAQLNEFLGLQDYNLKIRKTKATRELEMVSSSIFIPEYFADTICNNFNGAYKTFTYFVNSIEFKNNSVPYSFVSAPGNKTTENLNRNEIILNKWAALRLNVRVGDSVSLSYFEFNSFRKTVEKTSFFLVKSIVGIESWAADSELMPAFEGFSGTESCSDWSAGIEIDYAKIKPEDELYWRQYKGTPKAFISFQAASEMWKNPYGQATSVRFHPNTDSTVLVANIQSLIQPSTFGYYINNIKEGGKWSASNAVDFAGLFIALSFILLLASLIMNALLVSLYIENRLQEQNILNAIGFTMQQVFRFLYLEAFWITLAGILSGIGLGYLFGKGTIFLINSVWVDIVQHASFPFQPDLSIYISGALMSFLSLAFLFFLVGNMKYRKILMNKKNTAIQSNKPNTNSFTIIVLNYLTNINGKKILTYVLTLILLFTIIRVINHKNYQDTSLFMLLGLLILILSIILYKTLINKLFSNSKFSKSTYLLSNIQFKWRRYNAMLVLVALAVYLVFSTGLNQIPEIKSWDSKSSGTGGFAYYAETALPVSDDLNQASNREIYNLINLGAAVFILPGRVFKGDDASCLNLNRINNPRLLGFDSKKLQNDGNFSFASVLDGFNKENGWGLLHSNEFDPLIPVAADQTVITWGLGKKLGDTLTYLAENGDTLKLLLVAALKSSIFQGNVIMNIENFKNFYPNTSGANVFLINAPKEQLQETAYTFKEGLKNFGLVLEKSSDRLAQFNKVTNTYLEIFMILGSLSLILGIIGIALVVIRSLMERKSEMAIMLALGFKRAKLVNLLFTETFLIVSYAYFAGLIAALITNIPLILTQQGNIPWLFLIFFTFVFFFVLVLGVFVTISIIFKNQIPQILRNE